MDSHLKNAASELKVGNVIEAEAYIDAMIDEMQLVASNNRYFDQNAKCVFKAVALEYLYGAVEYSYSGLCDIFFNQKETVVCLSNYLLHYQAYEHTVLGTHILNIYIDKIQEALSIIKPWLRNNAKEVVLDTYVPTAEKVKCFCGHEFVYYYKASDTEEQLYPRCPHCNNVVRVHNKLLLSHVNVDILQNSIAVFAKEKLGYSYSEAINNMDLINRHRDLAVELYVSTYTGEYIQQYDCISVCGFNSKLLLSIMPFNVIAVYKLLAMLRDEPLAAKRVIDTRSVRKGILSAQKEIVEAVDKIMNDNKDMIERYLQAKVDDTMIKEVQMSFDGHFTTPIYMILLTTLLVLYKQDMKDIKVKAMLKYLAVFKNKPEMLKDYMDVLPELTHRFILLFSNLSQSTQDNIIILAAWLLKKYENNDVVFPLETQH